MLVSESMGQADPPVKRKRGRPPKPNKPAYEFPTFTMQLDSSPGFGGPNAELVSSQVVRGGEPNSFTPLMKVSPSPRGKKRRKSINFLSPLESPKILTCEDSASTRSYITSSSDQYLRPQTSETLYKAFNGSLKESLDFPMTQTVLRPAFVHKYDGLRDYSTQDFEANGSLDVCQNLPSTTAHSPRTHTASQLKTTDAGLASANNYHESNRELDLFGFDLLIDENGEATFTSRQAPLSPNLLIDDSNITSHTDDLSTLSMDCSLSSKTSVTSRSQALHSRVSDDTYHEYPLYAVDEYRRMSYSHELTLKPNEFELENLEVVYPSYRPTSDSSMYHMVDMHYANVKHTRLSSGVSDSHSFELLSQPLQPDITPDFDGFSVDTQSLLFDDESCQESADARSALRRIVGKTSRC